MKLNIDTNQFVLVDGAGNIRFYHRSKADSIIVLNLTPSQIFNLNDIMRGMKYFSKLTWYPLGGELWLYKKDKCIKLVDIERQRFFRFYESGWEEYKSNVHPLILSFLHDVSTISHHQSHARDENQSTNRFGRLTSHFRKRKQILSGTARNECHANAKWTKPAIISRRKSSDPWSSLRRRGRKHERRNHNEIEETKEDGELSSYDADDSELCSEPSVTIEH